VTERAREGTNDVEAAAEQIGRLGSAVLRRVFDATVVQSLRGMTADLFAAWEARRDQGALEAMEAQHLAGGTIVFRSLLGTRPGQVFIMAALQEFVHSQAFDVYRRLFGDDIAFLLDVCQMRRQDAADTGPHVPYHQDLSFVGTGFRILNSWITLDICGPATAAPGLEFAAARVIEDLRPSPATPPVTADRYFDRIEIDPSALRQRLPESVWQRPDLDAGDAILFDQFTVHRTLAGPDQGARRTSLEFRACQAAALPADHALASRLLARCDGTAVAFSL
jgi:hypothetical protein